MQATLTPKFPAKTGISNCKSQLQTYYRGFTSIDQEMEREIAMQWLSSSGKSSFNDKNSVSGKNKKN